MRIRNASQVQAFLSTLADGGASLSGRPPAALLGLALSALRGTAAEGDRTTAEDVVGDFLADEIERRRAGKTMVRWDALSAAKANGIARRRLRQLAVERLPGWNLHKQLRSHVAAALHSLPAVPSDAPVTLTRGDRLDGRLVALAVAWVLDSPEAPPRKASAITRHLRELYFHEQDADFGVEKRDERQEEPGVEPAMEASRALKWLVDELGPDLSRVLGRRLDEHSLAEIAADEGISIATAFDRCKKAEKRAQITLANGQCSIEGARRALAALREYALGQRST